MQCLRSQDNENAEEGERNDSDFPDDVSKGRGRSKARARPSATAQPVQQEGLCFGAPLIDYATWGSQFSFHFWKLVRFSLVFNSFSQMSCVSNVVLFLGGGTDQMPTVEEVCESFGLNDVQVEYTAADYANLTTYKLFQQHMRPLLAKDNPKVTF